MIRSERAHLYVAALSHPGMSGKNNEDNYAVSAYTVGPYNPTPSLFAIVSDGIGGHRAGEVASEMVVNQISEAVAESDGGNPQAVFQKAFYSVSEAIVAAADVDASRKGMGATAVCAWIIGDHLYIGYAGDSRLYLIRGETIQQLTRDHTWIEEAIAKGIVEPAQAKTHPNLHVIRRYLGSSEPPEPDLRLYTNSQDSDARAKSNQGLQLRPGDVLLMCSDGLTDLVTNPEIASAIRGRTLPQAAQWLIDQANARGGHDNITTVLLGMPYPREKSANIPWLQS